MIIRNIGTFAPVKFTQNFEGKPVTYKNNGVYYTRDSIHYIQDCIKICEENINNPNIDSKFKSEIYIPRKKAFEKFLKEVQKHGEVRVAPWGNTKDKKNIKGVR